MTRWSRGERRSLLTAGLSLGAGAVLLSVASAWGNRGPSFAIVIGLLVMAEAVALVWFSRYLERRLHRLQDRKTRQREMARRRKQPPLPYKWDVPDYPPPDLRPPAS